MHPLPKGSLLMRAIYVEDAVKNHPKTAFLCQRFSKKDIIPIRSYSQLFNRKRQSFRLQKQNPALIIAKKHASFLLPTSPDCMIGNLPQYTFSCVLNCPFSCSYCFLRGRYHSADIVYFVNADDFQNAIAKKIQEHNARCLFFSGFDSDSLAMEPILNVLDDFWPFFAARQDADFELRTKSSAIAPLLKRDPLHNVIVAMTLTPSSLASLWEKGAASTEKRLKALETLEQHGFSLGIRFDPIFPGYEKAYEDLVYATFSRLHLESIHSVTLGPMHLSKAGYKRMVSQFPDDRLLARLQETDQTLSLPEKEASLLSLKNSLLKIIPQTLLTVHTR